MAWSGYVAVAVAVGVAAAGACCREIGAVASDSLATRTCSDGVDSDVAAAVAAGVGRKQLLPRRLLPRPPSAIHSWPPPPSWAVAVVAVVVDEWDC